MSTHENMVKVWDPIVRIGHWTLVIAFFTAYFTEDDFLTQHVWAGYIVAGVIVLRLFWGFVGPRHARFSDFLRSPRAVLQYLRDIKANRAKRYIGHNPAGGAMIVALIISIGVTVTSGLMLYAIEEGQGPLAGWVENSSTSSLNTASVTQAHADDDQDKQLGRKRQIDEAKEEFWEEIHEIFANLALLLVGLHVAGVLFSSYAHKENLVKAMFTGRKKPEPE